MKILGIETSCDETGAALITATDIENPVTLLSNHLATSLAKHAITGGIIPEVAAREQVKCILPIINETLLQGIDYKGGRPAIDAIAVTYGPGLIGSLLVGVETAKTLSLLWEVPIIPVNHMHGHIYANWIRVHEGHHVPQFPAIALVVSGGHTDLVLIKDHGALEVIGGTRDDAAGEAFDKIGRLLGLSYPAGTIIAKFAELGNAKAFSMPRPMWDSKDFDFSFSGLKTHVLNLMKKHEWDFTKQPLGDDEQLLADLCASVQKTIIDVLVFKTMNAIEKHGVATLLLAGGVAANQQLTNRFNQTIAECNNMITLHVPPPYLCTDNAAMIATAGFYNKTFKQWQEVTVNPELYY